MILDAPVFGKDLFGGAAIAASRVIVGCYQWEFQQIVREIPIWIYGSQFLSEFAVQ